MFIHFSAYLVTAILMVSCWTDIQTFAFNKKYYYIILASTLVVWILRMYKGIREYVNENSPCNRILRVIIHYCLLTLSMLIIGIVWDKVMVGTPSFILKSAIFWTIGFMALMAIIGFNSSNGCLNLVLWLTLGVASAFTFISFVNGLTDIEGGSNFDLQIGLLTALMETTGLFSLGLGFLYNYIKNPSEDGKKVFGKLSMNILTDDLKMVDADVVALLFLKSTFAVLFTFVMLLKSI